MFDLATLYERLSSPQSNSLGVELFNSLAIPGREKWHVGKSESGLPAVLIALEGKHGNKRPLTVKLENLRVEHDVRCRISSLGGESSNARYSLIQCLSDDFEIQNCFLRTVGGILGGLSQDINANDLTDLIDRLVALFTLVRRPRTQSIRGLWAELAVILQSSDPGMLVDSWHSNATERFDFSHGIERVEVKSSSARSRNHVFSFEQVYPPSAASVLVASIYVEEQTNGVTLGQLWDLVSDAASNSIARVKVEHVCVESLGEDLATGRTSAFDWELAIESLQFFRVESIPRLPLLCPMGVSQIQFRSDLGLADQVALGSLPSSSELHRCCLGGA